MIRGERRVSENKYSRFKQVFRVPEDSDIDKISAKLDGKVLFIIVPKKTNETKQEPKEEELRSPNETKENKELEKFNNEESQRKDDDNADKHEYHGNDLHDDMKEESEKGGTKKGMNGERRKKNLSKDKERVDVKKCLEVLMETAMENICKKKVVFVSVVVALSIGLYLSHKL
ncbi:Alpha crystallin/Hsp20 domain [Macleaya cordata]|uniref:Alpha crystallin/Hsp20 domain n=1 Tax=Macleaya cordata TaxID=56857 RepID=A0A200QEY7_MACCD|nr:Alpha crystallin/Hsp20 domain [Macleaya cordata]